MSDFTELNLTTRGRADDAEADEFGHMFRRISDVVARRRHVFIVVFAASALAIQSVAFLWPGTFAATAAVLIQKSRLAPRVDVDPSEPTTTIDTGITEEEVNSEIAVLTSAEVLADTARTTGIDRAPEPIYVRALFAPLRLYDRGYAWWHGVQTPTRADRALRGMARAISATRMKDSNVMVVTYEAGDPGVAEKVLNQLLNRYLDQHLRVHNTANTEGFFSQQASLLRADLDRYENDLERTKTGLNVSEVPAERDVALKLDAGLQEEQATLLRRRAELDASIASYLQRREATPAVSTVTSRQQTPAMEEMKAEVLRLELEQVKLDARFLPGSPLVVENEKKLALARETLNRERADSSEAATSATTPLVATIDQEVARLAAERGGVNARLRVLGWQLRNSRERLLMLDRTAVETTRIQRLIQTTEQRYLMYLNREDKARVDAALDQGRFTNVSIVQRARASLQPVRPARAVSLLVALGGGLLMAFLTCAWLELSSRPGRELIASAAPRPA